MLNFLIDTTALFLFFILLGIIVFPYGTIVRDGPRDGNGPGSAILQIVFIGCVTAYYTLLEGLTGKTLGKLITGTKVVDASGNRPNFTRALLRSLCRSLPFDVFTFLGADARGWHDSITKTWVVKSR